VKDCAISVFIENKREDGERKKKKKGEGDSVVRQVQRVKLYFYCLYILQ